MNEPTETPPQTPPRRRVHYLWVVGVLLYIVAVWLIGWRDICRAVAGLDVFFVIAAAAAMIASHWLRALKWRLALGPGANAVGLYFVSKTGGAYSPMRIGEFSPMLFRRHRTPGMAAWILLDRILETSATLALGAVGLITLRLVRGGWFIALTCAVCLLILLPAYVVTRRTLFEKIALRCREGSRCHRLAMFLASMSDQVKALTRKVPVASVITLAATCLDLETGILLIRAFGHSVSFPLVATAQCLHTLVSLAPFAPNATGVPYAAAAALLHEVGAVPLEALAALVALSVILGTLILWSCLGIAARDLRKELRD